MNPFCAFLEAVQAAEGVPDGLFTQCLDSPFGDKFEIFQFRVDLQALNSIVADTRQVINSNTFALDDQQMNMRKVAAVCLSVVKTSANPNSRLTALKEILLLGSVPGSKGNGISTQNVLEHITGAMQQVATNELNDRSKGKDVADAVQGSDEDDGEEPAEPSVDAGVILSTAKEIITHSSLFLGGGSSDIIDNYIDTIVSLLYLGSVKAEFAALKTVATNALDHAASTNVLVLISIMRCLLSVLSLKCDDARSPESVKSRTSCHRSAVKVVEMLVCNVHTLNAQYTSLAVADPSSTFSPSAASADEEPSARLVLPTGFAAVVGVLQRMLLSCPDKAPIRAQVASSICAIVKAMVSPLSHKIDSAYESAFNTRAAVDRFLTFLTSNLKAPKVARRSFAVEVAALLIRIPNIWFVFGTSSKREGVATAPCALLKTMCGRCRDVAATVRTRALAAVAAILDDLGEAFGAHNLVEQVETHHYNGFPVELCKGLYSLIVEDSFAETSAAGQSFTDTLKALAADEKPTTRVKALRAYSTALSIRWPKLASSSCVEPLSEVETVSMLVTDDDIDLLAKGCSDSSVSVRKQAVDSITDLLASRPVDAYLQDAWVTSVLPLMVDPEATVQQRVAQSLFRLVVDTCIAWWQSENGSIEGALPLALRSLGWVLVSKLVLAGLYKMLKSSVPEMLRNGYLCVASNGTSSNGSISVKELVTVMEFACTLNLDGSTKQMYTNICNSDDRDIVSHSAWVILEAMIDNENAQSSASGAKCCSDMESVYRSDFVIRCWESRMSTGGSLGSCADDVRILRVLQSMAARNEDLCTSPRFRAVCKHLESSVCGMTCGSSAVAAALAVIFAPMSCFRGREAGRAGPASGVASLATMQLNDPAFSAWFEQALLTVGRVLDISYSILYEAVVGQRPDETSGGLFGGSAAPAPRSTTSRRASWSNEAFGESDVAVSFVNAAIFVVGNLCACIYSSNITVCKYP